MSNSAFAADFKLFERHASILLLLQLLDLQFGILQARLAQLEQLRPFLEFREQLGQRHFS